MKSEFTPVSLEAEFCQIVSRRQGCSNAEPKDCTDNRQVSWIRDWSGRLLDFLTGSQTLSIQQRSHSNGQVQWIVYDPAADFRRVFDSEAAVRVWLEKRYYQ
ncbi:MAG: hypothetical protein WBB01_20560 [Phormidesmis sp.]